MNHPDGAGLAAGATENHPQDHPSLFDLNMFAVAPGGAQDDHDLPSHSYSASVCHVSQIGRLASIVMEREGEAGICEQCSVMPSCVLLIGVGVWNVCGSEASAGHPACRAQLLSCGNVFPTSSSVGLGLISASSMGINSVSFA